MPGTRENLSSDHQHPQKAQPRTAGIPALRKLSRKDLRVLWPVNLAKSESSGSSKRLSHKISGISDTHYWLPHTGTGTYTGAFNILTMRRWLDAKAEVKWVVRV